MFDVPPAEKSQLRLSGSIDLDFDWNIGLIYGHSGSGKSTIAKNLWPDEYNRSFEWNQKSVIDDFDKDISVDEIARACSSVGFNTIPAWLRPYGVLSTGEKFRVDIARRILESSDDLIVVDEFTSTVDRQVAKIASHAVQKYIRKSKKKLVAVSCHSDIIEWLSPDWTLEPATMEVKKYPRGSLQRPKINVEIKRIPYECWNMFSKFHYLTAELNKAARCFGLFCDGQLSSFSGILHRPHPKTKNVKGVSRLVTLPDFQGLGLAMILVEKLGAAYKSIGMKLRTYPAHPALVSAFMKAKEWHLVSRPIHKTGTTGNMGGRQKRPCHIFQYCGESGEHEFLGV